MFKFRRRRHERIGSALYEKAVAAAREPFLYASLGVPDTLDGRFDLVSLYSFLLVDRLEKEPTLGVELAQAVFDAMFSNMDVTLRELGVGDPSVAKRMEVMWNAFHGRARAYRAALAGADPAALEAALARNVWRGRPNGPGPMALARLVRAEVSSLAAQSLADLARGSVRFLTPATAASGADPGVLPGP